MEIEKNRQSADSFYANLEAIRAKIRAAAERSPGGPRQIMLVGVSKGQPLTLIRSAAELGLLDMGENYTQELLSKAPFCNDLGIRWHFIGKVQSNKVKHMLPNVTSICSVDSLEIAERIARERDKLAYERPPVPIMIQVNLGNDPHRAGLQCEVIDQIFERFLNISGIAVSGLMTIPPYVRNVDQVRPFFKKVKELFDNLKQRHKNPEIFNGLSMGMSRDYEIAVEEGATVVRIGEAVFGARPKKEEDDD